MNHLELIAKNLNMVKKETLAVLISYFVRLILLGIVIARFSKDNTAIMLYTEEVIFVLLLTFRDFIATIFTISLYMVVTNYYYNLI